MQVIEEKKSKKHKKTAETSESDMPANGDEDQSKIKTETDKELTKGVQDEKLEKKSRKRKHRAEEEEKSEEVLEEESGKKSIKRKHKTKEAEAKVEEKVSKKLKNKDVNEEPKKKKAKIEENADKNGTDAEDEENNDPGCFKNFGISEEVAQKLRAAGVKKLFPVQYESYNQIVSGSDVILQSRTGSGKTFSFAIPLIEMLGKEVQDRRRFRKPVVLVLTPTRELTKQVADCFSSIASNDLAILCVYGGTPIFQQEKSLREGVDILVGTPGRVQDLINRGTLDLSNLKHVVLDEVDRMLDMGFAHDVDEILQNRYDPEDRTNNPQTLLFSATMPEWARQTSQKYLKTDCQEIDLMGGDSNQTSKTVQHLAIQCSYFDRPATINSIIKVYSGCQGRCIIFCKTKKDADELALSNEMKSEAHVIHGDVPQEKREMVLKGFREGRCRCLVATDVAARGLDIPEVDLVIQCSPPQDVESYIHRSGRTGRAGRQGTCVLFYKKNEERELRMLENRANIKLIMVGPPTSADIVRASAEDAARALSKVSKEAAKQFEDLAGKLLEEKGALQCMAAALAVISGNTELKQRSLISSREGFVTYHFKTNLDLRSLSYVWNALKRQVEESITESITGMRFCKDRKGCVFDIPVESVDQFKSQWNDGKYDTLQKADTLPELEEQAQRPPIRGNNNYGNNNYGNNQFRGNRNGPRGGGGFQRRWNN